jgi:hypothetical protein
MLGAQRSLSDRPPDDGIGREEYDRSIRTSTRELNESRPMVEDPEPTPVRRQHEIAALGDQVVHGHGREVEPERIQLAPSSSDAYTPVSVPA